MCKAGPSAETHRVFLIAGILLLHGEQYKRAYTGIGSEHHQLKLLHMFFILLIV
jgi:hypothetical protein